jgi:membrane-associated phospholipid phosphatase
MANEAKESIASLRERLTWTLGLVALSGFGFLYIDARNARMAHSAWSLPLETRLDVHIPFIPEFIFPYLFYYPWLLLPLFVLRTRESFFRSIAAFTLMQVIAQIIFVLFPSHMVRPIVTSDGFASDLVRLMYQVDLGWNLFPSLHVAHSVIVALIFCKYGRKWAPAVCLVSGLIAASTVLVKQHYVIDIPAGVLLAGLCFRAAWVQLPLPQRLHAG